MIFDAERITELVIEWQRTNDEDVLTEISEGSTSLIEVIVSSYDSVYRDDLIQESYARIQYALPYFNPSLSTLHNYLTTVIRNICHTYATKQDKEPNIEVDLYTIAGDSANLDDHDDILTKLITRNRIRFPSLPASELDHITAYIYYAVRDDGLNRKIITAVVEQFCIHRSLAQILYQSTVVHLRLMNIGHAKPLTSKDIELTLLPDIKEALGEDVYNCMLVVFSGMNIRLP
jgi:hypothetical protein